jgi:hypothetical protein
MTFFTTPSRYPIPFFLIRRAVDTTSTQAIQSKKNGVSITLQNWKTKGYLLNATTFARTGT